MRQLILHIDDKLYPVLLRFLETLGYVKIVKSTELKNSDTPQKNSSQLVQLQQLLAQQSTPLFQSITDPVAWQKQQRDEWS